MRSIRIEAGIANFGSDSETPTLQVRRTWKDKHNHEDVIFSLPIVAYLTPGRSIDTIFVSSLFLLFPMIVKVKHMPIPIGYLD